MANGNMSICLSRDRNLVIDPGSMLGHCGSRFKKKIKCTLLVAITVITLTPQSVGAQNKEVTTDRRGSPPAQVTLSKCKSKELGKSRNRDSEVCARSGSSQYWQPVLKESDVYSLTSFCSQYLQAAMCAWFEKLSFWYLDNGKRPGSVCVRMIREYILAIKTSADTYGSVSSDYISKSIMPPITKKYPTCTDPKK